jgi:putative CocE/NonD family hydrolase
MRDSPSTLAADAYLPPGTGPWPAVLIQTPYNKNSFVLAFTTAFTGDPLFQSLDYAFVVLDWRGFFASAGAAHSGSPNHGQDGYDAVEWIAAQSWCTGNVGTGGPSASPTTPAHIPPPEPRALN